MKSVKWIWQCSDCNGKYHSVANSMKLSLVSKKKNCSHDSTEFMHQNAIILKQFNVLKTTLCRFCLWKFAYFRWKKFLNKRSKKYSRRSGPIQSLKQYMWWLRCDCENLRKYNMAKACNIQIAVAFKTHHSFIELGGITPCKLEQDVVKMWPQSLSVRYTSEGPKSCDRFLKLWSECKFTNQSVPALPLVLT